ncbi:protein LSM12 homolog [Schistocerca americana]|uniref:protein LSM12 homolog n=1 Tax=Schistocerca americana TaxID=7009 RepID=UPI001F4FC9F6|nr:protein LSM12 homolog [Schistocerca americana]XP_047111118.1 protein LSM12 homolog [Schistocerca piceifrons]XP_049780274.1 protein LSM12 homolog [Schistocerca cancellata]XP_049811081.1 protein LSM12 homolog [Schistocerca nitens]XP_049862191.1 protein LSM12 homolog [Schistocerca gregaria]XP_049957284.1 protein LSM12 homolog [Schistocerca serialis cubense]
MRQNMAGVNEWFGIGSIVVCKTCYNKEIEGEVLAFDPTTKMLILKCPASSGRASLNDVHIVNLALVSDVQVKKEVNSVPEAPASLNLQRLNSRVRKQIEEKRRLVASLAAGVSPEGQKLFLAISRTIKDVTWQGPNILVFEQITITPPYKLENIRGDSESKAFLHIRKVMEKHAKDQAAVAAAEAAGAHSSPQ